MHFSEYFIFCSFETLVAFVKNDQRKNTFCFVFNMLEFSKILFFPCEIITWKSTINYFFKEYLMGLPMPMDFNIHISVLISVKFHVLVSIKTVLVTSTIIVALQTKWKNECSEWKNSRKELVMKFTFSCWMTTFTLPFHLNLKKSSLTISLANELKEN